MSAKKTYTVSNGKLVLNLEPAEEGGYIVTSPLDPELITEAETLEEAFENAADAMKALRQSRTKLRSRIFWANSLALHVVVSIGLAMSAFPVAANEEKGSDKQDSPADLVERLASRNEEPTINRKIAPGDNGHVVFAKGYSDKAWAEVAEAHEALFEVGHAAFPELLKHIDDRRYAITAYTATGAASNRSVAALCKRLIELHINPFDDLLPEVTFDHRERLDFIEKLGSTTTVRAWFDMREGKEQWELQAEVGEWVIQQLRAKNFRRDVPGEADASVERVKETVAELRRSKRPVKPKYLFSHTLSLQKQ